MKKRKKKVVISIPKGPQQAPQNLPISAGQLNEQNHSRMLQKIPSKRLGKHVNGLKMIFLNLKTTNK